MVIIGLTGGKQQGKSTVGNLLRQMVVPVADIEFSDLMMDLANNWLGHLPAAASQSTDTLGLANQWIRSLPEALRETEYQISCPAIEISHDHPHYQAFHHHLVTYLDNLSNPYNPSRITRETKVDHRHIYIWLAVTLRTLVNPGIWGEMMSQKLAGLESQNLELITVGGVRTPEEAAPIKTHGGWIINVVKPGVDFDESDAAEARIRDIKPDITVINNGDIERLRYIAGAIWGDLQHQRPAKLYAAVA